MTGKDSLVDVLAGIFTTRTICGAYYPLDQDYPWGIRKFNSIYGEGVGLLHHT